MGTKRSRVVQFTDTKSPKLPVEQRVLLFVVERDPASGRDGSVGDWYGDLKEAVFMFSPSYLHFASSIFYNTVRWDELREYEPPSPAPGHTGYSTPTAARRTAFNKVLRNLVRRGALWAFTRSVRAVKGLGGRSVPLLQIWTQKNRNRPKDILAASLTENGFKEAKALADAQQVALPWQLHPLIVESREFAAKLTGNA